MRHWVQGWSNGVEFAVVIGITLGWAILASCAALFHGQATHPMADPSLWSTLVYEVLTLAVVATLLEVRGWRREDFHLSPSLALTGWGVLLFIAAWAASVGAQYVASLIAPHFAAASSQPVFYGHLGLPAVIAASIVNPLFEEVIVTAYLFKRIGSWKGPVWAMNISVLLRVLYHLYQGPMAIVGIAPFGILMAFWYLKRGKLWPILIAHGIFDFIALYSIH